MGTDHVVNKCSGLYKTTQFAGEMVTTTLIGAGIAKTGAWALSRVAPRLESFFGAATKAERALLAEGEAAGAAEEYTVGIYNEIRGTAKGLDAHHVGQKAVMEKYIPGYDPSTAPAILVPKVGHTIRGPYGIVSRSTKGFETARDVIARDIKELRRVYSDIPNSQLQKLIRMNKELYPTLKK